MGATAVHAWALVNVNVNVNVNVRAITVTTLLVLKAVRLLFCSFARAGEMRQLQVQFCPRDGRVYEAQLPIYLDGDTSEAYFTIEVCEHTTCRSTLGDGPISLGLARRHATSELALHMER
jgi:hypothetical protein